MALKNVIGIDHAVVMVRDLDKSAENYKRLGFTVSPRGIYPLRRIRQRSSCCTTSRSRVLAADIRQSSLLPLP